MNGVGVWTVRHGKEFLMRVFVTVASLVCAMLFSAPATLAGPPAVKVDIIIVEASRRPGGMDAKLKAKKQAKLTKQIVQAGFKSARISDTLTTQVEVGARVSLEVLASPKPRILQVRVNEVSAKNIRLTVGIKALDLEVDTAQGNGGTFVIVHPQGPKDALFLAVTPQLAKP